MLIQMQESTLEDWLSRARGEILGVDTETNGKDMRSGEGYVIGVSICFQGTFDYESAYFPLRHKGPGNLPLSTIRHLKATIDSAPMLVFHNAKFDLVALRSIGIDCFGKDWYCTMVISHLINENWPMSKALAVVAPAYLGEQFQKVDDPRMKAVIDALGWEYVPVHLMETYAAQDAELALRLMGALFPRFAAEGLQEYWVHKRHLIETVIGMEREGVYVNTDLCEQMLEQAEQEMAKASKALGGINPRSSLDMKRLFIDTLHLPPQYHPKTNNLTFDKNAIAVYERILETMDSPVAQQVKTYRGWGHAASNFYRAYLNHLGPDGKIRPSYLHHKDETEGGTLTGRLSCRNPNLQQIPRVSDKPWNGRVKEVFVAPPGYKLWEADFGQLELRMAAAYAMEETLLQTFREGRDVFSEMSKAVGLPRHETKTLVYTIQYGGGIKRIAEVFNVSTSRAEAIRNDFFSAYPGFNRLSEIAQATVRSRGNVRIWSGRYRHFTNRERDAHKGLNSMMQGGAADIMERRMVALNNQLGGSDFKMLLQVHDSAIAAVKIGEEKRVLPEWQHIMANVGEPFEKVKFAVEIKPFGG